MTDSNTMMERIVSITLIVLLSLAASFQMTAQTKIIKGDSPYGEVLYNFDGQYVRRGDSKYSAKLFTISGKIPIGLLIFLLM